MGNREEVRVLLGAWGRQFLHSNTQVHFLHAWMDRDFGRCGTRQNYLKIEIHEQNQLHAFVFNMHSLWVSCTLGTRVTFPWIPCAAFLCSFLCPERKWCFSSPFSASTPPLRDSSCLGKTSTLSKVRRKVQKVHWIHSSFLRSLAFLPLVFSNQGWCTS